MTNDTLGPIHEPNSDSLERDAQAKLASMSTEEQQALLEQFKKAWTTPSPPKYDSTFYPFGGRTIHLTDNCALAGANRIESTVTSKCGKTYTRWLWAEFIDKPMCQKCSAASLKQLEKSA